MKDKYNRNLRDLRISVTDKCNFRCPYCMPADIYNEGYKFLSRSELLNFEEITQIAQCFVSLGVEKIRLTGGEPLIRQDLESLIAMLSTINGLKDLAMTTNGYLLKNKVGDLKKAGLNRLTISLDSLDNEIFKELNGKDYSVKIVLEAIDAAKDAGFDKIKINCVVQKGINEDSVLGLVEYCRENEFIVRFIEFMDVGNINGWDAEKVFIADDILNLIDAEYPVEPVEAGYTGEVAMRYKFKDGTGEIGIIASVTKPFCGDCSRLRLSIDGKLYTCLFANSSHDLRTLIRSGKDKNELVNFIRSVWTGREDRYSEIRNSLSEKQRKQKKIEMYQIGG